MMTNLHLRLSALAQELRNRGEEDLCQWIQKWIAHEQRAAKKPRGEPMKKVRLEMSGTPIYVPTRMIKESEETDEM